MMDNEIINGRPSIKTIFIAIMLLVVPVMISEPAEAPPPPIEILTGFGNFTYNDDGNNTDRPVNVYYYRPENYPGNDSKVIFTMHGSARDAVAARNRIVPYADRYNALLVAPEFSIEYYPNADDYNRGFVKDGNGTGNLRNRSDWTFLTIEEIFDIVRAEIPGSPSKYSIQGNSGAGQFISRLPLLVPEARIEVAAGSNNGWYTLPMRNESYPNGIGDLNISDEQIEEVYRKSVVTVVGENDTDPNSYNLTHNEFTDAQGLNRYDRALFYHDYMRDDARARGVPFNWDLLVVDNVGHDAELIAHAMAGAVFAGATTPPNLELSPIDDTYIDEYNPGENYGSNLELRIDGGNQEIAFLKFNLSSVTEQVAVAMLKFYVSKGSTDQQYVHEVSNNSWNESSLTWNNAPPLGEEIGMTTGGEKDGILYIEVTDYINEKIGGLASLAIQSEDNESLRFNSSETSHFSAQLDLWTGSQPTGIRLSWIQDAANTTMTIMWETCFSSNRCEVQYGITKDCELGNVTGFNFHDSWYVNYNHQVTLTGLTPNTTYFYRVSGDLDNNWSSVKNFTTAADTSINWTFFVAADSQSINGWKSVVNAMKADPEGRMLFFAGDILGNFNSQTDWREWTNASEGLISNISYISCKGNHEYNINKTGEKEYFNFSNSFAFPPNERWFSYNYSNCHFIVLDTQDSNNESQKAWLEQDLQAAANDTAHPWIFVTFHKPVYGDGGHNSSINARENFVPLFRDYGVDMVFSGHNHFYQRTYPLNLTNINNPTVSYWSVDKYYYPEPIFVTAGRAAAQGRTPTNDNGWMVEDRMSMEVRYLKVDVYTNMSIHVTARYINNTVFDDFWIVKTGEAPPRPPPPPPTDYVVLIPRNENWRYNETDPQPNTSPNWNESGYNDSEWLTGPAPLGFGDSTTYGTVLNDNDGSYYFRKTFNLDPAMDLVSAKVYVASDNFANVYLNGILISNDTGANHGFNYWNKMDTIPTSVFLNGTNTVAVYVYNTAGSSDAYMNLELIVKILVEELVFISKDDNWSYNETDPQPNTNPNWNESGYNDSGWLSGPAPFGFGDSTTYGTVLNDNDGSYYFRKTFNLDPGTELVTAKVYVASDNYANVYLNGILISNETGENHEFIYWNKVDKVPINAFQNGTNTVAVFVYNSASSSDAYMNLELIGKKLKDDGNQPPTITSSDITFVLEGQLYYKNYEATDPENEVLTWNLTTNASWLSINASTGELSGTPPGGSAGTYYVNVSVWDPYGGNDSHNFTLTVNVSNQPPKIITSDLTTAGEDQQYYNDYNATDPDADILNWSLITDAGWLSIDSATGELSGTPLNADVGSYWVNVTVSDGKGGLDWSNFTLTVTNTNDAPIIITSDVITAPEDQLYSVNYDANDIDPGPDILTWHLNTNASFLNINSSSGLLSGTPLNANVGSFWVNVSVDDGNSGWDWSNFTLNVTNTNDPPTITTGDITTATEDVYYSNDYDGNDIDPTGDTLTWSLHTNSSWLTINSSTGLLSGIPTNADYGTCWVNVTLDDGNGGLDWTNFTISVADANDAPTITTPDDTTVDEDELYSVDYDATDIDLTNDVLTWSLDTNSTWLSINSSTGVLSGVPQNADVGSYWVNVTVSDGRGGLDWSNFTLTVTNINDAPILTTSDVTLAWEDSFYSVDYNATDIDPTNDVLTWNWSSNASWLSFNTTTGFLNGTPTNADVGSYWVNITIKDDKGGLSWTNFSLQVFNTNDEPTITTGDTSSATEDSPYNVDYNATDIDPVGDTLTWSLKTDASWLNINPTTGVLWGTPLNAHVGTYWVNVTVSDGNGGFDWTNFTITVSNINDDPIITTTDIITSFQDELYTNTYTANDVDPTNDILRWSWSTNATWLSFNNVTGVLNGTPTIADLGWYWVNITIIDGNGGLDFHNFTVTVVYLNKDPVITTTDIHTVNEDEDYSVDYEATDIDSPLADQIWSLRTNATWLAIDPDTGVLSGTPRNSDVGSYWVIVKVIDGDGGFTENAFTLWVFNTNDAPEITTADVTTATEDETFSVDYDAEDIDPTGDKLAWSLNTDAAFLSINSATGLLSGTPDNDDVGSYWVNVTVSDGNGGLISTNFTLTVENVNDRPTISGTDIVTAVEDTKYYVDYNADDIDPTDDTLVWILNTNADWLKLDPATGELTGIPANDDVGSYWVNVTVSDGKGGFASRIFTLKVSDINDAPVITTTNVMEILEDVLYSVDYDAIDVDSPLADQIWTLTTNAKWLSIDSETGVLSGTPSNDDVGTYWVTITVSDGEGGMHYMEFNILVLNVNDEPTITNSDKTTADEGVEYWVDYEAVDIDPTDDILTWSLNTNASFLKIDPTTGILYGTPEASDAGSYWVEVIVLDGNGGSDRHKFTIIVKPKPVPPEDPNNPTNNAPVITNKADAPRTAVTYTTLGFQFTASDPDSDVVIWRKVDGPEWLYIISNNGIIYGIPSYLDIGHHQVMIEVSDGKGGEDHLVFNITVFDSLQNDDDINKDQDDVSDKGDQNDASKNLWFILILSILIVVIVIIAVALALKRKKEIGNKEVRKK